MRKLASTVMRTAGSKAWTGRQVVLLLLLLAASAPYGIGLGSSTLWDANEAFYAETARTMVETGDYVSPSFNAQPRFNKPVLPYWMIAGSYHLFGVSERSERIPIALAGLALIAVAFSLGNLLGSREVGLLAAIVLATAPRFLMFARRIIIDVHLAAFTGLVLLCFVLAEARPGRRRFWLLLMYVAMALGTLTKGPVAILVPGLAIVLYLASDRRLGDLRRLEAPLGALIGAAIVLPWYVLVYQVHGWQHIESFVLQENLGRYAQTMGGGARPIWFYLPVMLEFLFPWSLFVPAALWITIRRAGVWGAIDGGVPADDDELRVRRTLRLLLWWVFAFVVFFSLSRTKQDLYILPIVPALAALVGMSLAAVADERFSRANAAVRPIALATGTLLLVAGIGMLVLFVAPGRYPLAGLGTVTVAAGLGGLAVIAFAATRRLRQATIALGATFAVAAWIFVIVVLPDFERYKPVRPLAETIARTASDTAVIGAYRLGIPSLVYYLRRPVIESHAPQTMAEVFGSDADVYVVMADRDYQEIRDTLPVRTYVVDRRQWIDARASELLAGRAFPELFLVSNRAP